MDYRQQMYPQMPGQQYSNFPPSMQHQGGSHMPSQSYPHQGGGQSNLERRLERIERQVERMNRRVTQIERQIQYWGQMGGHH